MAVSINKPTGLTKAYLLSGMILLCAGLIFGLLAAMQYVVPGFLKETFSFERLRPLHVTCVLFWILFSAIGTLQAYMHHEGMVTANRSRILAWQWVIMSTAILFVLVCDAMGYFGGREYMEFPPLLSIPLIIAWLVLLVFLVRSISHLRRQPVYVWMWLTGGFFLLFTFLESYLWTIPFIRQHIQSDMTIQWKANGSMVGSWNMMIYGSSIYLMEKISGEKRYSSSTIAFVLYFTGFTNLMFNWGHHIYTLPTLMYVKHISYIISMTELFIFGRILYSWRSTLDQVKRFVHIRAYRWIMAADLWIFLNLLLAILLSIPAINVYTHGTHFTVAHSMGATIGINTFLLLAFATDLILGDTARPSKSFTFLYWLANLSLFVFWISLILSGVMKARWQMSEHRIPFSSMMNQLHPFFLLFFSAGCLLVLSLLFLVFPLIRTLMQPLSPRTDHADGRDG